GFPQGFFVEREVGVGGYGAQSLDAAPDGASRGDRNLLAADDAGHARKARRRKARGDLAGPFDGSGQARVETGQTFEVEGEGLGRIEPGWSGKRAHARAMG